jgi:hypothetical protein
VGRRVKVEGSLGTNDLDPEGDENRDVGLGGGIESSGVLGNKAGEVKT